MYWRRVQRGNEAFSFRRLGAFAQDLAAIGHFFVRPWSEPVAVLRQEDQSWLIGGAGFDLRALGRLREAEAPMRQSLELAVAEEDWANAAIRAGNLSELLLTLGDVTAAIAQAEVAVHHADASRDGFQRLALRTTDADALAQAGQDAKARALFVEAEQLQAEWQPQFPRLYSFQGYQFCDLLLDAAAGLGWQDAAAVDLAAARAACREVRERATTTLALVEKQGWLLDVALDHLNLGRGQLGLWRLASLEAGADPSATARLRTDASQHLNKAVEGLRKAGTLHNLPRGLLHRATFFRLTGDLPAAATDLAEALDLATSCGMRLHETDAHLGLGWLALARNDAKTAAVEADLAAQLIAATGYHRRDEELRCMRIAIDVQLGGLDLRVTLAPSETSPKKESPMSATETWREAIIVVIDLAGYSDRIRTLEQLSDVGQVDTFNRNLQEFLQDALRKAGLDPHAVPRKSTGDGAIVVLREARQAHAFAEAVQLSADARNRSRTELLAHWYFRIGAFLGAVVVRGQRDPAEGSWQVEVSGTVIGDATRLEGKCETGEVLVDSETWADLGKDFRKQYGPEEEIRGKRDEKFRAHRRRVVNGAPSSPPPPAVAFHTRGASAGVDLSAAKATWRRKIAHLEKALAGASDSGIIFSIQEQLDEARGHLARLEDDSGK